MSVKPSKRGNKHDAQRVYLSSLKEIIKRLDDEFKTKMLISDFYG